jgi:1,4-dihydroxy-2-naphthoate octaprenyltransferase
MEANEILNYCREAIVKKGRITISYSGKRPWTSEVAAVFQNGRITLDLPAGFPVDALMKRPRVSFFVGPDESGREIHGSGIVKYAEADGTKRVDCIPYRFAISGTSGAPESAQIIERRQYEWREAHQSPSSRGFGKIRFWYRAMRAITLPLSVFPILIGAAVAMLYAPFDWLHFVLALSGGVAAHMAANLLADYFDFTNGTDTTNALSSHTGVLVDELAEPDRILIAAMACLLITAFSGGMLMVLVGWPVLFFGLAGIIGGYFYAGGKFAWKRMKLGEVSTGFLLGPLMLTGSFYAQTGFIAIVPALISIGIGLMVAAISFGNNIRDAFFDQESGIVTLPVAIGAKNSVLLLAAMLLLPYAISAASIAFDIRLLPVLLMMFTLPWPVSIIRKVGMNSRGNMTDLSKEAARLILPLQVIRLHFRFCLLLFAGCVLAFIFPDLLRI